ncbi:MAG: hypothetical protein AAF317_01385 [Pseudomonadota bacterium]
MPGHPAAPGAVRPGVTAEAMRAACVPRSLSSRGSIIRSLACATGFSVLETPALLLGEETILQPGMVLAVDRAVTPAGDFRARVGDSITATEEGCDRITARPKGLEDFVL